MNKKFLKCLPFVNTAAICAAMVLSLFSLLPLNVKADTIENEEDWKVNFTSANHLSMNFSGNDINQYVSELQPGDNVEFTIELENSNSSNVYFYMSNDIISSFEESVSESGAYGYQLTYTSQSGQETLLYSSSNLGAEGSADIKDTIDALGEYTYLDTFVSGQTGTISLKVSLDGETEGNAYQSNYESLSLAFAVEKTNAEPDETVTPSNPPANKTPGVKTGDYNYLYLYGGIALAGGLILVIIAIVKLNKDKKNKEEAE